jgi:hypothetical protein
MIFCSLFYFKETFHLRCKLLGYFYFSTNSINFQSNRLAIQLAEVEIQSLAKDKRWHFKTLIFGIKHRSNLIKNAEEEFARCIDNLLNVRSNSICFLSVDVIDNEANRSDVFPSRAPRRSRL